MNLRKYFLISTILLTFFLGACAQLKTPPTTTEEEEPITSEDVSSADETINILADLPQSCLDYPSNRDVLIQPFTLDGGPRESDPIGSVTMTGTIKTKSEDVFGEVYETVSFVVDKPTNGEGPENNFYNYYNLAISRFNLGVLENGRLRTTAKLMPGAEEKILASLNKSQKISLTLRIPEYIDRGAPAHFSFACIIE